MSPSLVANADLSPVTSGAVKGRVASVYSELQTSRIDHALPLPSVLKNPFKIVDGPASSAAGNPGQFRATTSSIKTIFVRNITDSRSFLFVIYRWDCEIVSKSVRATVRIVGAERCWRGAIWWEVENRRRLVWRSGARWTQCDLWNLWWV